MSKDNHGVSVEEHKGGVRLQIEDNFDGVNDADWAQLSLEKATILRDELTALIEQL